MSDPIKPSILNAIDEALNAMAHGMNTRPARVGMLVIGLQESRFEHRRQLVGSPPRPVGPAKSFWQMERGGGCLGLVTHPMGIKHMRPACATAGVAFTSLAIWNAIEVDDVLAATAARVLLYTDPRPLPQVGDAQGMWGYYINVWRPGKPHRQTWNGFYAQAVREEALRWGR